MEGNTFLFTVLSALCFLPGGFPHHYILVEKEKSWTEAQSYCREKYTDLASLHNDQDLAQLIELTRSYRHVWIGRSLYNGNSWRWSLKMEGYYGEGEAEFRKWKSGEPNNIGGYENCVAMDNGGKWADDICNQTKINQRLKDYGVSEDVKLRWVRQADGKIFHQVEEEEEEEGCTTNS